MKDIVCNNFNRLVDASPLSKREIAKLIKVNENTLQRWKNKESYPELPNIEKLAAVLGVSPLEFYEVPGKVLQPKMKMSQAMSLMAAIPDDIYEMASKLDPSEKVWDEVRGLFDAELKKNMKRASKVSQQS